MSAHRVARLLPWLAGAGLAAGQIALSSSCSLPRDGRCTACGGCVVALGVLVSWAVLKKHGEGEPPQRGVERTEPRRWR